MVAFTEGLTVQDRSGVRRLLRGRLAQPLGFIEIAILLVAAWLSLGDPRLFLALGILVAITVGVDLVLTRMGRPVATDVRTRVWLAAYPFAFVVLGVAGYSSVTGDYHGEVIALMVIVAAAFVGMVESPWFAAAWSLVSAIALAIGIALTGPVTPEAIFTVAAIFVGCAFGASLAKVVEDFLGHRQRLIQEITAIRVSDDPFRMSSDIVEPLVRWTPMRNASVIWFTESGRSIFLSVAGDGMPPAVQAHRILPASRDQYLRSNAASGPWITGWAVRDVDEGYGRDLAAAGVAAVAYVPLHHEGRVIGVLAASVGEADGGRSILAEQFPILVEVADIASATLGPALATFEQRSTAADVLDRVLREHRYGPVFQPVRDLLTDRIVGFEALSRFEAPIPTELLFHQAGLLGRLRELEIATLEAAVAASSDLPAGAWLSLNTSADLLVDTDVLAPLLRGTDRPLVLELSEHVVIADYAPILAAMARLGPRCRLAVDDAGAGFASLRHILEVRPAFVKLDLGLVRGVADDASRRALVAGMVHFARDGGFELIAEGVETDADLEALRRLGVGLGQGYLLGRPATIGPEALATITGAA
jgi:EAL domain-containing protein (putative c-di-GMP-specific phosphodiesterase class I)